MNLELTTQEAYQLREILERYLIDLKSEEADTDRKDFRAFLKQREAFMKEMIKRLQ